MKDEVSIFYHPLRGGYGGYISSSQATVVLSTATGLCAEYLEQIVI